MKDCVVLGGEESEFLLGRTLLTVALRFRCVPAGCRFDGDLFERLVKID